MAGTGQAPVSVTSTSTILSQPLRRTCVRGLCSHCTRGSQDWPKSCRKRLKTRVGPEHAAGAQALSTAHPPPCPLGDGVPHSHTAGALTLLGLLQLVLGSFFCLKELVDPLGLAGHGSARQVKWLLQAQVRDSSIYPCRNHHTHQSVVSTVRSAHSCSLPNSLVDQIAGPQGEPKGRIHTNKLSQCKEAENLSILGTSVLVQEIRTLSWSAESMY